MKRLGEIPIHPLFWAAFPVLALWAPNAIQTPPQEALRLLWPTVLAAAVMTLAFGLAIRSLRKGAMIAVAVAVPSLLYGYVFRDAENPLGLIAWAGLLGLLMWVIARLDVDQLTRGTAALNVVGLVLVLFNGIPAVMGSIDRVNALEARLEPVQPDVAAGTELPDIWFIVPDRYSREDTLLAYEGVNNGAFVEELRGLDFQVFDRAAAHYATSILSLAASLNMRALDDIDHLTGDDRWLAANALLKDHQAGRLLTGAGYEYVHLGSWAEFSADAVTADRVLTHESRFALDAEFYALTVAPTFLSLMGEEPAGTELTRWRRGRIHGAHQAETLRGLAERNPDHPQFVFAHLIFPHAPFVFDEDGSEMDPFRFEGGGEPRSEGYRRQLGFTNLLLRDVITELQAREDPPIIIVAGDEGLLPADFFEADEAPFPEFTQADHHLHNAIFAAAFVPDGALPFDENDIVTPTNLFRAAIALALGQEFTPIENRSLTFADEYLGEYYDVSDFAFSSP